MVAKKFALVADILTEEPAKIHKVLVELVGVNAMLRTDRGFWVRTTMEGRSAAELNRIFLSSIRRCETKVRLKAEWTHGQTTERFTDFDPHDRRESAASKT